MQGYQLIAALLSVLSVLLGGGLIGVVLRYKVQTRKLTTEEKQELRAAQRLDFEMLLNVVTGQRDDAYRKLADYDRKFEDMELEIHGLRLSADLDPFPNWIIDLEHRYIFVNREFEKQFLEPEGHNYRWMIGRKHEELWPVAFCKTLYQLDEQAKRRPDGKARAVTAVGERQITVHKFPIRIRGVPVAYAGYITDVEPITGSATGSAALGGDKAL